MPKYFVFNLSEDGNSFDVIDEQTLKRRLEITPDGDCYYGNVSNLYFFNSISDIPSDFDTGQRGYFIIKGDLVVPRPEKTVTRFKI